MTSHYFFDKADIFILILAKEIEIALPAKPFKIELSEDCDIIFENELIAGDVTILNNLVSAHKIAYAVILLATNILSKCAQINVRTQELIALGFSYMGAQLSLSVFAQSNGHAFQIGAMKGWGGFPKAISTIDDGELVLNNASEMDGYYATGLNVAKAHYDSGRALKLLAKASTTQAQLDAIIDNR